MVWQLLAIWAIVIVTTIWFVRDETRRRRDADIERGARYYAHADKYRHLVAPAVQPAKPARRPAGLSEEQRAYFRQTLQRS